MRHKTIAIFLTALMMTMAAAGPACSHMGSPIVMDFWDEAVEEQSDFVRIPSTVGAAAGLVPGLAAGLALSVPAALAAAPFRKSEDALVMTMFVTPTFVMQTTSMVAGGPFYVAEKLLWDAPRAILAPARGQ